MSLAEFALLVGADPKWVQNARRLLGRPFPYTEGEARRLGLVRALHAALGLPLRAADRIARDALAAWPGQQGVTVPDDAGSVHVEVDVRRYLSDYAARLSRVRTAWAPRQRGRRPRRGRAGAVERARRHGIDVELLRATLALTPAERLKALDENQRFVRQLRRAARR